jgi:hypothetical protein
MYVLYVMYIYTIECWALLISLLPLIYWKFLLSGERSVVVKRKFSETNCINMELCTRWKFSGYNVTLPIYSCNIYIKPSVYPLLHIIHYIQSVSQSSIMYQYRRRPGTRFRKARWTSVAAMYRRSRSCTPALLLLVPSLYHETDKWQSDAVANTGQPIVAASNTVKICAVAVRA